MDQICYRQGLGDTLADGLEPTVRRFGKAAEEHLVSIKGQEPWFDSRGHLSGWDLSACFNPRGSYVSAGITPAVIPGRTVKQIAHYCRKAREGHGQVLGIVGEAGVGKSRLVLEFHRAAKGQEPEDFTYLEGQCVSFGHSIPYLPFLGLVKRYFDIQESDRPAMAKRKILEKINSMGQALEDFFPCMCDLLSLPLENSAYDRTTPGEKRKIIFEAIRAIFPKESQSKPLLIFIDDLNWIDRTSQELLSHLIEGIAHSRILVLLCYRPGYSHPWGDKSYYHRIVLNPLTEEESVTLTRILLDMEEITADLRRLVLGKAEGNPLYLEEIVWWLLESKILVKSKSGYVLEKPSAELVIPETVQDVIMARIDRLEQELKRTMQIASVIGREFLFRLLTRITGMGRELETYLGKLQSLELIYGKSLFSELEYTFKHGLFQDVVYHSLLLKTRKQLHGSIARAIEELYGERIDEQYEKLVYHYQQSDNREKALQYLVLAARKAADRFALSEAISFGEDAIGILETMEPTAKNRKLKSEMEFFLMELKAISGDILPV